MSPWVQDGVGPGRIAHDVGPGGYEDLAGDQERAVVVAVVDVLQEVAPLLFIQGLWTPIVVYGRPRMPGIFEAPNDLVGLDRMSGISRK